MIAPTLGLAIYITWKNRNDRSELIHNMAVCFWICANSVWMYGEFYENDGTRPTAVVFFFAGLLSMAYYYIIELYLHKGKNLSR